MKKAAPAQDAGWAHALAHGRKPGRALLWVGAGILAVSVHSGAIAWALYDKPEEAAASSAPPAIMIEMAAEPVAVNTETNQITTDVKDSAEVKNDAVKPVEHPDPEPQVEPEPTPPDPEPQKVEEPVQEPDPEPVKEVVQEPEPTEVDTAVVAVPLVRPKPPVRKPVEEPKKREIVKKHKPAPASVAALKASAEVEKSDHTAANRFMSGLGFGAQSPADWKSRLIADLEKHKRYPASALARREEGVAYVRFSIDRDGNVLSASLARSSGSDALDEEVVAMVRRASPVPPPPPGIKLTFTAPVRFALR